MGQPVPVRLEMTFLNQAISRLVSLNRNLTTTRTADVAVARRCLGRVFARHGLEVGRGSLDFAHQHVNFSGSSINLVQYGSDVEVVAPPLDFYLLQMTLDGSVQLRGPKFEVALRAGTAFVMNPGAGYRKCWDRQAQQLMLKIPRSRLECLAFGSTDFGKSESIEFAPTPMQAGALSDPLQRLLDQLSRDPQASSIRAHEDVVVRAVLASIPHQIGIRLESAANGAVPYYVLRAEHHLQKKLHATVNLSTLVELTGVSKRTLQDGFQRFRGKTPSQVSRDLRLDLVRETLVLRGCCNVTAAALEFGFSHLGRFAQAYATRFGESPSETRRRARSS